MRAEAGSAATPASTDSTATCGSIPGATDTAVKAIAGADVLEVGEAGGLQPSDLELLVARDALDTSGFNLCLQR